MTAFYLEALSPERAFYTGECVSATVPLQDGQYGILANHLRLIAAVVPGEATFVNPDGTRIVCAVSQGMIDVRDNRVRMLCESILLPEEIDEDAERRGAETAAEDMKGKQSRKEYLLSQIMFARAVNNIRVKKHGTSAINIK